MELSFLMPCKDLYFTNVQFSAFFNYTYNLNTNNYVYFCLDDFVYKLIIDNYWSTPDSRYVIFRLYREPKSVKSKYRVFLASVQEL